MKLLLAAAISLLSIATWANEKADLVLVDKSDRILTLFKGGEKIREFPVVLGSEPVGHKAQEGDGRTPEGQYVLDYKNENSRFHKSIHISYPNAQDTNRAKDLGVIPGGDVMIHGQKNGLGWLFFLAQRFNWTDGCIALTNSDMDVVWQLVDSGTPIEIRP